MIALRALAGIGAAAIFPVTLSALVDAYPAERRAFAVAVWSAVSAAGAVAGTLVAGILLEAFWWGSVQLAFGVAAPATLPGLALLVAQNRNPALPLDPVGATLSMLALGALVFGVIEAPRLGWTSPTTLLAFCVGVAAAVGFVVHELRSTAPTLDVPLFRNPGLGAGSFGIAVLSTAVLATYRDEIARALAGASDEAVEPAPECAGAAIGLANALGPAGDELAAAARSAFASGVSTALWIGAAVLAFAAIVCALIAPARSSAGVEATDELVHT